MNQDVPQNFKQHIECRLEELHNILQKQSYNYRKYKFIYNILILLSILSSCAISVLEIACPFTIISCCITTLGLVSSICIGVLTKFNISAKKTICEQNIITLKKTRSKAKRLLLYNGVITQSDMEKLFASLDLLI